MTLNSSLSLFRSLRLVIYVTNIQFSLKSYDLFEDRIVLFSFGRSLYIKTFQ